LSGFLLLCTLSTTCATQIAYTDGTFHSFDRILVENLANHEINRVLSWQGESEMNYFSRTRPYAIPVLFLVSNTYMKFRKKGGSFIK